MDIQNNIDEPHELLIENESLKYTLVSPKPNTSKLEGYKIVRESFPLSNTNKGAINKFGPVT